MKSPREEKEPTNRDLINRFEVLAASLETRFNSLDVTLETMNTRIDGIDERLILVERRLGSVEVLVSELQEEVRTGFRAYDTDSIKLLDHERRIKRIERAK